MMSYKSLLSVFLFLLSSQISAQLGDVRNIWSVGVNGGVNLNSVNFEPTKIKQNSNMGITGGITGRYISEKYFAMICGIQLELNYSQRGWDEKIENNANTYNRSMHYLEIPFMAHLAFGKERRGVQFFVNAGPQLGFLISEKENMSVDWDPSNRINAQYGLAAQNKFDYGIVAGAGLELKTGAGNFLLEGRYYLGLNDFYHSTKKDPFSRSSHATISVRLSYLFDLMK